MEGLIILIVTAAALLALGIFIVVKVVKGPKPPEGIVFEAKMDGNEAILVVDKNLPSIKDKTTGKVTGWLVDGSIIDGQSLAVRCAAAITATETAFREKGVQKADVNKVIFLYQTEENYSFQGSNAYATTHKGMFGKGIPMAVIRSKFITTTYNRAQPAIHELVHILNKAGLGDYSRPHEDPNLWLGPGGDTSAEGMAVIEWKKIVEEINDET